MSGSWKHDDLQGDLAATRRDVGEIVAERLSIGSFGSGGQMDVFSVKPSWSNPNPTVYEIKVSRSDFLADTQAGKYRRYLPYCRRLYFATPAGMLDKKEIPEGMGLCVRGERGWRTVVSPRVATAPDGWEEILFSLLLKRHPGPWDPPTREERTLATAAAMETRRVGKATAPKVADALRELDRHREAVEDARRDLCHALKVNPDTDHRDLRRLASAVMEQAPTRVPREVLALRGAVVSARRQIEQAVAALDAIEARP